jgi:hypothetical protein
MQPAHKRVRRNYLLTAFFVGLVTMMGASQGDMLMAGCGTAVVVFLGVAYLIVRRRYI